MIQLVEIKVEQYQESAERMMAFIVASQKKQSEISRLSGVASSTLSRISNASQVMGDDVIDKLTSAFFVNPEWLRSGIGEMGSAKIRPKAKAQFDDRSNEVTPIHLVDETDVTYSSSGSEFRDLDNGMVLMTIPLVDEYAYASYPHGWKDPEYIEELPKHSIVLPKRDKSRYRAFSVRGDSMDDGGRKAICSGDIAVGREIEHDLWFNKLYMNGAGKDYIIVHQDGIFIKRITRHDTKEGIINCASTNPDKELFPDFTIRLSEVYQLYIIAKVERDWRL